MSFKCEYCNRYYSSNKSLYTHNHKFHLDNTKSINKKKHHKNINKDSNQVTDDPVVIEQDIDEPLSDELVIIKQDIDEPLSDEPVVIEQDIDEPLSDEPVVIEQDTDEPLSDEPVVIEQDTDEPVMIEQDTDEPVMIEQDTDEPVMIEQDTDEPDYNEQVTDDPLSDEQVVGEVQNLKNQKMNFYQDFFKNNIYFDSYSFLIFCTQSYLFLPFLNVLNNLKKIIIKPFHISNKKSVVLQEETDITQEETELSQEETDITQEETDITQEETDITQEETDITQEETELSQEEETELSQDNTICIQCNILSSICWCKLKNDRIRIRKGIDEFKNEIKINQEESIKITDEIKELTIKINKNRLFN